MKLLNKVPQLTADNIPEYIAWHTRKHWHKDQKEVNKQILYSVLNSILKRGGILKWTVTDNNDMLYVTFIYPTYNVGVVDLELP